MKREPVPAPVWPASARWHLSLLGGVRLQGSTAVHTRFATRAITALLARLALWPQRDHPREELMELLWPEVDAATGRRRLRQALSLLKAVLEPPQDHPWPVLRADRQSVRVIPGTIACDVHQFETFFKAGAQAQAMVWYSGEFMPGFYDEWIHDERMRLTALHDRLTDAMDRDDSLAAVPAASAPTSLTPSKRTRSTRETVAAPRRTGAPGYLTRYFDNPHQFERLLEQVGTHRLVSVLGPGGSGKTRLAVNLVDRLGGAGADKNGSDATAPFGLVAFVPLAAAHNRAQFLEALQTALQIAPSSTAEQSLIVRLDGVRALLVLDNAEQLVDVAGSVLNPLAAVLPQLHLLVTSRLRLGLDGERTFQIEPMPVPVVGASLQAAAGSPAVGLFVDRASAARGDFHLGPRNHTAIAELVRVLEGMPLAIELAASRIRAFTPAEMLDKLRSPPMAAGDTPGLDLLSRPDLRPTQQSRHASMQRAIEWSWQQLSPEQQRLAAAMAEFPGGCSASMVGHLLDRGNVPALLEALHAHSIIHELVADVSAGDEVWMDSAPRFQLYVPIREYAAAQFDEAERAVWRARQRAWAVAWLHALPATPPLPWLRAERANLANAFASAAADAAGDDACGLLTGLHPVHEGVTLAIETLAHARAAVRTCPDDMRRSRAFSALVPLLLTAGDAPEARNSAEAALAASPPGSAARAWALQAMAHVHWRGALSPAQAVLPWLEEARQLAEAATDANLPAAILNLMALVSYGLNRDAEVARRLAAEAQTCWEQSGNRHGVNQARHNVAVYQFQGGQREQALASWDALSAEAAVLHDTRRLAITSSARAAAFSDMHRWPQARVALRESLRQSWRAMRLYEIAFDLWNVPRILAHLREPHDAVCLMAFATQFWEQRFGALSAGDLRHALMVERLSARQIDARSIAAEKARGRHLPLADAVALALRD